MMFEFYVHGTEKMDRNEQERNNWGNADAHAYPITLRLNRARRCLQSVCEKVGVCGVIYEAHFSDVYSTALRIKGDEFE